MRLSGLGSRRRRVANEDVVLNLIPIMNLFTALIPFLLLSAAFFHLAIIRASVPTPPGAAASDSEAPVEKEPELRLRITAEAYDLSVEGGALSDERRRALAITVPRRGEESDEALSQAAYRLKQELPKAEVITVVARASVPYEQVVSALDAVRNIRLQRAGVTSQVELFGRVVLGGTEL